MKRVSWARAVMVLALAALMVAQPVWGEYGDVVLNQRSGKEGVRPVIFSHWFHRIRFACKVCHQELGIKMRVGGNDIRMTDIIEGKYCGSCHNNDIAWGADRCDLCHSGKPGLPSGIFGGHETSGPGRY